VTSVHRIGETTENYIFIEVALTDSVSRPPYAPTKTAGVAPCSAFSS
jgi:hypothetical protein